VSAYHVLGGSSGWRAATLDDLRERDGALELSPLPGAQTPVADVDLPTGVAVDAAGRVLVLDALGLARLDPCTCVFERLPCFGGEGSRPRRLRDPHGLAVSARGDIYVADTGNRRVQVLAAKGLVLRAIWQRDDWEPWDVVVGDGARVYVSDRSGGLVHVFVGGRWTTAWGPLQRPTALALDHDGRLYVMQEGDDEVAVFSPDGERLDPLQGARDATAIGVDGEGVLWVAGRTLSVGGVRCGGFDGHAAGIAFDPRGRAIIADAQAGALQAIAAAATRATSGHYVSEALDSERHRCEWHRVVLRGSLPSGASVRVETFTAEVLKTPEEVAALGPDRWAGGQVYASPDDREWDCLVLSPPGRYLWLRLTVAGDGATSAVLARAQVHFPRETSLRFLPAVFAEDPESADVTGRVLGVFDAVRDGIADQLASFGEMLDARTAPAAPGRDFLGWLASWLDLVLDRGWPEERRRRLLRAAPKLYRLRGTPAGLQEHLRLYAGVDARVLEHFRLRRWLFVDRGRLGGAALWGASAGARAQLDEYAELDAARLLDDASPAADPLAAHAHRFTVFLPLRTPDAEERRRLETIVAAAKPAQSEATLRFADPGLRVSMGTLLGVDSVIGRYPPGMVTGDARLGDDAVLGPAADDTAPPGLRIGSRSRIGSTSVLT
jgi:phage tail-like protein